MTKPLNEMSTTKANYILGEGFGPDQKTTAELQAEVAAIRGDWDRSPRVCALPGCGQTFTPTRPWQAYHSPHCRRQAYWKKNETVSVDYLTAVEWALTKLTRSSSNPNYAKLEELRKRLS